MSSGRILGVIVLLVIGLTAAAILVQPPAWLVLLLGSIALAVLYTVARMNSRFDPLDQRFGSCIPPINWPPTDQK
jgi:4-hydroxybenzoate polyprenyltransferase